MDFRYFYITINTTFENTCIQITSLNSDFFFLSVLEQLLENILLNFLLNICIDILQQNYKKNFEK